MFRHCQEHLLQLDCFSAQIILLTLEFDKSHLYCTYLYYKFRGTQMHPMTVGTFLMYVFGWHQFDVLGVCRSFFQLFAT